MLANINDLYDDIVNHFLNKCKHPSFYLFYYYVECEISWVKMFSSSVCMLQLCSILILQLNF